MKTNTRRLQLEIAKLYPKRAGGDLTERNFQQKLTDQTLALYRAVIRRQLANGETIECEHHAIWTHFRLMQSILREQDQQAISLFLTEKRLFRLQSTILPDRPPTADTRDNTSVDAISIGSIKALNRRFRIRLGACRLTLHILRGLGYERAA